MRVKAPCSDPLYTVAAFRYFRQELESADGLRLIATATLSKEANVASANERSDHAHATYPIWLDVPVAKSGDSTWQLLSDQASTYRSLGNADVRLLHGIYDLGAPFSGVMKAADLSAWPVFVGAVPVSWFAAALRSDRASGRFALTVTFAEASAIGGALVLKRVFDRPRPYASIPSIVARSRAHGEGQSPDPYSFPSGHAAMSFSIATAVALRSERWYVTLPAMAWATSVSLSRVWLGVHYPSDVLAGAILGSGMAVASHLIANQLIHDGNEHGASMPVFSIAIMSL